MSQGVFDLHGQVSVVTGGGGALGSTMASGLAQYGSDVAIMDVDRSCAETTAEQISALGRRGLVVDADVTNEEQLNRACREIVDEFGRIDVLVSAAGITHRASAESMSLMDWNRVLQTNLTGVFLTCKTVAQTMMQQGGGRIINVASVVGERALSYPKDPSSCYCASKGGVIQLTRALAYEWAKHNIRVNAIAPTYFETEMAKPLLTDEDFMRYLRVKVPLGRPGRPEELIGPVVFLASEASSMITGHILEVDGGWTAL